MGDMHGDNIGAALGIIIALAATSVVWVGLSVLHRRRRP